MDIRKLQRAIVDGLEDVKAQQIVIFNTEHLSPLFERVIVASGTSNRQTKALASSVITTVKKRGLQVLRTEGQDNGEWIIVDCGAAVVHIMQPTIREYYHLEELWGGKKVAMKMGDTSSALPKAEEPASGHMTARRALAKAKATPAPRKAVAKKPAAPRVVAQAPARKTPARKSPAGKSPAGKAPAGKAVARKSPARKSGSAKTPGAKRAPARPRRPGAR